MEPARSKFSGRIADPRTWGITFFGACIGASCALADARSLTLDQRVGGVALVAASIFLICIVRLPRWRDSRENLRRVSVAFPIVGILIVVVSAVLSR